MYVIYYVTKKTYVTYDMLNDLLLHQKVGNLQSSYDLFAILMRTKNHSPGIDYNTSHQ